VTAGFFHLVDVGPGVYNLTNGLVTANNEFIGDNFPGLFNHFGGFNQAEAVKLSGGGEYDLYDGAFGGGVTFAQGTFKQLGGLFNGGLSFVWAGNYVLQGGVFQTSALELPSRYGGYLRSRVSGGFLQSGGTNTCQSILVWGDAPREATAHEGGYTLTNGSLLVSGTVSVSGGSFGQIAGFQTNSGVSVMSGLGYSLPVVGYFNLYGGMMMTPALSVAGANYAQNDGTNLVSGNLGFSGTTVPVYPGSSYVLVGSFSLSGGLLTCSNATVVTGVAGNFAHSGGALQVSNLLAISGRYSSGGYRLSGGQLSAPNISLSEGGTFRHTGGTIANPGLITFAEGAWVANTNQTVLGRVVLSIGASNSVSHLTLSSGVSIIRFSDSSSIAWSNQAILTIEGWQGSPAGGGHHQIFVGNNSAALTPQQLTRMQFHNPAGINGTFAATILSTGEIVPTRLLGSQFISGGLVLTWPPGATLQTATNVTGPYSDLPNTSPYTNHFTDPRRFFRLRN
jgi:hypothetical protein